MRSFTNWTIGALRALTYSQVVPPASLSLELALPRLETW